jgi:hypothetical protein
MPRTEKNSREILSDDFLGTFWDSWREKAVVQRYCQISLEIAMRCFGRNRTVSR